MKFRRNKKDFFEFENDRKTHVKLYKAGKQWVSSLISSIGLIRVFKGRLDKSAINTQLVSKEKDKKSEDKLSSDGLTAALKGAAVLGAVAGGATLTTNTALADTKQLDSNQNLATKDTVNLSSGSGSSSVSDSLSTSESNVQTESSVSKSESVSLNTDTNSNSTSETKSNSNSSSESISESKSNSQSQANTSQSISRSESLASSSITNSNSTNSSSSSSYKTELESMLNQASEFMNSSEFVNLDADKQAIYKNVIARYTEAMKSGQFTETDYAYGVQQLRDLSQVIKSQNNVQPQTFAVVNNDDGDRASTGVITSGDFDMTDQPVYDDFNTWAGYEQSSKYGANNTIKVTYTQDENDPNRKHWTITFLPNGSYQNSAGTSYYKLVNARMGFALSKDLTIDGSINFKSYFYDSDDIDKGKPLGGKHLDENWYLKDGVAYDDKGVQLGSNKFYPDTTDGANAWYDGYLQTQQAAKANPNGYGHDQSLTIRDMNYAHTVEGVNEIFFEDYGYSGTSPRAGYWGARETTGQTSGRGMFSEEIRSKASINASAGGQYQRADFNQAYSWKTWGQYWGASNEKIPATFEVSFDTISDPTVKTDQGFSGVATAFGTEDFGNYYYGHLTGEEISQVRGYKNIKVVVNNTYDTKGLGSVTVPAHDETIGSGQITHETQYTKADGSRYTVKNPYDNWLGYTQHIDEHVVQDGGTTSTNYSVNVIVPKENTQTIYIDSNQTSPLMDDNRQPAKSDAYTQWDIARSVGMTPERIAGYKVTQERKFDEKTGTLTITNKYVRGVTQQDLKVEVDDFIEKVNKLVEFATTNEEFLNQWTYDFNTHKADSYKGDGTAQEQYRQLLEDVHNTYASVYNDVGALDPVNLENYGDAYKSILDSYLEAANVFNTDNPTSGIDFNALRVDISYGDGERYKVWKKLSGVDDFQSYVTKFTNLYNTANANIGNIYTGKGSLLDKFNNLATDAATNIKGQPVYNSASPAKQDAFDEALGNLQTLIQNNKALQRMTNYYEIVDAQNKLKEAIYYLDHLTESESISLSESQSDSKIIDSISKSESASESEYSLSVSQSESTSTSLSESTSSSSSLSESLSRSTSLSESLSTSGSLSESLSRSSSLSESLSASSSLSESLSTSSSLSESLSTSSSLSESLSTSSSLSESLSTSSSLSESLSTSSSLSESLSTSSSLSESLSTSSSLSESLSTSSSLSESLSTSSSLSESLSTSSSLSESLSTSSSLSESLSTSSSLSESLGTSSSLSESLSTSSSLSESLSTSSSLSESLSTSSSLSESLSTSSSLSESLSTSSSLSESLSTSSSLSESLSTSTSFSESLSTSSSLSESLSTSSSLSESLSTSSSLSESLSTSSSLSESLSTSSSLSESLSTSSSLSESLSTSSSLSESLSTSSSLSESLSTSSSLSESLSTSSSLVKA